MREPVGELLELTQQVRRRHARELLDSLPHLPEGTDLTDSLKRGYRMLTGAYLGRQRQLQRALHTRQTAARVLGLVEQVNAAQASWFVVHAHIIALKLRELQSHCDAEDEVLVELAELATEALVQDVEES